MFQLNIAFWCSEVDDVVGYGLDMHNLRLVTDEYGVEFTVQHVGL